MAHRVLNGVRQIATGTGAGALTLGAATSGMYQTMAAAGMSNGDTAYVRIESEATAAQWEIVLVSYSAGNITRTFDSKSESATGGLISFGSGNKIVSSVISAQQVVTLDLNDDVSLPNALDVAGALTVGSIVGSYYDRDWFAANADATTAQASADNILLIPPTTDGFTSGNSYVGVTGAKTRKGINTGHIAIGPTNIHAFVSLHVDETYSNSEQEMRGVSSLMRYFRTTADEGTLGWDIFGGMSGLQVTANNTQYIRGNMKGHASEIYFAAPSVGTYSARQAYNYQSYIDVGAGVTVEYWAGGVVNSPTGAGAMVEGNGLDIKAITMAATAAAIKLRGTGNTGRIFWPTAYITEESSGILSAVASSVSLAGLAGAEAARAVTVASAVNRIEFRGAITTVRPSMRLAGSDTNIGVSWETKGNGAHLFRTNIVDVQLEISGAVASTTVWPQVRGGTASINPRIFATGNNLTLSTGAAIATSATAGFICIPAMSGTPSGAPTGAGAGDIPMVYDTSAHKIWFYSGSWRGVLVA